LSVRINTLTRSASIRRVVRLGEDGGVGDDEDAVASGGGEIVSKPKGSAAVLQKVFGADAGTKAAQNMQKANQIVLPKVPTSAKVPGRITESEQLRIDITRQLVPSYFNLVRRNVSRICLGCVLWGVGCGVTMAGVRACEGTRHLVYVLVCYYVLSMTLWRLTPSVGRRNSEGDHALPGQ
jgi:hypothetical protein